jgi:hypothetical protein
MALSLVDNHFGSTPPEAPTQPAQPSASVKRPRAESTSSSAYNSGSDAGRPIPALSSFRLTRFKAPFGTTWLYKGRNPRRKRCLRVHEELLQRLQQLVCLRKAFRLSVYLLKCAFSLYSASCILLFNCTVKEKNPKMFLSP